MFLAVLISNSAMAIPTISNITDNRSSYPNGIITRYDKCELTFSIGKVGAAFVDYNPFNPNVKSLGSQYYNKRGIQVDGVITDPLGATYTHPAFWYDTDTWKLRFSPSKPGIWKVKLTAKDSSGTTESSTRAYQVADTKGNPGFVRINADDPRYLRFSNGAPYHPIGCALSGTSQGGAVTMAGIAFPKLKEFGGNFSRVFFTSTNIEPYAVGSDKSGIKALNKYDLARAKKIDEVLDIAIKNRIYLIWVLDDWTYLKDTSNQYIRASGRAAPCANVEEFFSSPAAKEIYKRKLRYWMARWGYSTNLMAVEFVNELGGGGSAASPWHIEMGNYIKSFNRQPHFATSSNGSGELRTGGGIPWADTELQIVTYHDYAKYTCGWTLKSTYSFEPLGSTLQYPWQDTAVWAERLARIHFKRYGWKKPLSWTEFGLIYRKPGGSGFPDWDAAYKVDTSARHVKDAIWAGMLAGMSVAHWKLDYILGTYGGGEKFRVFGPLAKFVKGENFAGLVQETTYPVSDPINPSPQVSSSNGKVMAVTMHGPSKAYLYVKNMTDTWFYKYYSGQSADKYADSSKIPKPSTQSSTIRIKGMTPGSYTVERWSTTDPNPSSQLISKSSITVGSDGIASIVVADLVCDVGIKLKLTAKAAAQTAYFTKSAVEPQIATRSRFHEETDLKPSIKLSLEADTQQAAPGDTVTYIVSFRNDGPGPASNVQITIPIPEATTFAHADAGGAYDAGNGSIVWIIPSLAPGATGNLAFQVRVN